MKLWCFNSTVPLPHPRNLGLTSVTSYLKPRPCTIKHRRQITSRSIPSSYMCILCVFSATLHSTSPSGQQRGGVLWHSRQCFIQVRSHICHRLWLTMGVKTGLRSSDFPIYLQYLVLLLPRYFPRSMVPGCFISALESGYRYWDLQQVSFLPLVTNGSKHTSCGRSWGVCSIS